MELSPIKNLTLSLVTTLLLIGCASQATNETTSNTLATTAQPTANDLSFKEFYKFPVGPRGLEPTEKLLALKGKRVRVTGYMVKEEEPTAGLMMLAPLPVSMAEKEDGPADDLPPATLFVHPPAADKEKTIPYKDGLWQLTGTLELGNQEEANGRTSFTRLILD